MKTLHVFTLTSLLSLNCTAAIFNVRNFGATGDGSTPDTPAIQQAIDASTQNPPSQVLFPPGNYLSGTLHLQSHVTINLTAGATLTGSTNLDHYASPDPKVASPGFDYGRWHHALLLGVNIQDVHITGPGTINGNQVHDPLGEEHMRGPHTILLTGCNQISLRDIQFVDSANYAVLFLNTDNVTIHDCRFIGGWDGIHWRGTPDQWCNNVTITDCQFYTGDDAIAGRYWDRTLIRDCTINSSCNGIRLIGPARNLVIQDCLFLGPGRQPHRTSGEKRRTNMLAGIVLQPGAWDATTGPLEDVLLSDITMHNVASPVSIWTRPGNTANRITIQDLHATSLYRAALSVESWTDDPIQNITIRSSSFEYTGSTNPPPLEVNSPGVDPRPLPSWGLYARNVQNLTLDHVQLTLTSEDTRPPVLLERVQNHRFHNSTATPHLSDPTPLE
jgi:polygalacturonase